MYAEGLLAQAIEDEIKKKEITGLLIDCQQEYGSVLEGIELRKKEGKSKNCYNYRKTWRSWEVKATCKKQ